jgi:hypothetical protein
MCDGLGTTACAICDLNGIDNRPNIDDDIGNSEDGIRSGPLSD